MPRNLNPIVFYEALLSRCGGAVRSEVKGSALCVCDMACDSHHHGNARSPANYLLELAYRDTVNDT